MPHDEESVCMVRRVNFFVNMKEGSSAPYCLLASKLQSDLFVYCFLGGADGVIEVDEERDRICSVSG